MSNSTSSAPNNQLSMGGGSGSKAMRIGSELVAAAIIFFFMVVVVAFFFYLYAKRQLRSAIVANFRASFAFAGTTADLGPARGLDAAVLRALPATVHRAPEFEEGVECAVCLSELADGEEARVLPKCGHGFHRECIDVWFCSHSTCPLCRSPVAESKPIPLSGRAAETPVIPSSSALSATATVAERAGEAMVIEIQRAEEGGLGTSAGSRAGEETTSTVAATMRTLSRIWSYRGGAVEPAEASSSANERGKALNRT